MIVKRSYESEQDKNNLLLEFKDYYVYEDVNTIYEKYISFTDIKHSSNPVWEEKIDNEINNLKKQNTDLENALVELASMVGGA